jgi:hypothetical protein
MRMLNAFELAELFESVMQAQAAMAVPPPVNYPQPVGVQPPDSPLTEPPLANTIDGVTAAPSPEPADTPDNQLYDMLFAELDVPIRPAEKNHSQKAEWFRDFLDTQEGLQLSPKQRDICFEFIWQHQQASLAAQGASAAASFDEQSGSDGPSGGDPGENFADDRRGEHTARRRKRWRSDQKAH